MGHQYKKVSCDTASLTLLFNDSKKYKLGHEYRLGIFLVEIVTANQLAYGDSGGWYYDGPILVRNTAHKLGKKINGEVA